MNNLKVRSTISLFEKAFSEETIVSKRIKNTLRVTPYLRRLGIILVLMLVFMNTSLGQATRTWDGDGANDRWNNAANWSANTAPVAGDNVIIPAGFNGTTISRVPNISLNSLSVSSNNIIFTANGTATTLTINNTSGATSLFLATGNTLTLGDGTAGNAVNLTLQALGVASNIDGNITITANTTLNIQTTTLNITGNLSGAGAVTMGSGTLNIGGNFSTSGTFTRGTGTVNYNGTGGQQVRGTTYYNLSLTNNSIKTLQAATNVTNTLTVNAGATLALSTFTLGATNAPTSVVLYCGATTGSSITGTTGTLTLGGGVTVNSAGTGTNEATISCPVALGATRTFTIADDGTAATDLSISGIISGGGFGITKTGAGTMVLSGANTYTGATTVNAGLLKAGVVSVANTSGAFGNNSALILADLTSTSIDITGFNTQIGSLSGGGAIGGNVTLGTATLSVGGNNASPAAYAGIISGTGALTKIGTGTLTLTGANTFSGKTTISNGTVSINTMAIAGSNSAIGTGSNSPIIDIGATGVLQYTGTGHSSDRVINLTASGGSIDASGAGTLTLTGGVTGNTFNLVLIGTGVGAESGVIATTSGTLTKNGTGIWSLSGANTFSGATNINAGTLSVNTIADAGTNSSVGTGSTTPAISIGATGILQYTGTGHSSDRVINLTADGGTVDASGSGLITLSGGVTGITNNLVLTGTGAGIQSGVINTTNGTLTKNGIGTWTLSGTNTFTGGATLSSGTLNINNTQALGASGTFTINGGTIDNTSAGAITTVNYPQTWGSNIVFTGTQNLNLGTGAVAMSASRQVTVNSGTLTIGGVISGATFGLTKAGTGTLTLSGTNTFTGGTTLNTGTLNINSTQALGTVAGTFTINGGTIDNTSAGAITTLNYPQTWGGNIAFTGTQNLNLGTGAVSMSESRIITVTANTLTVGGVISGATFNLTKEGNGALSMGANTVTINGLTISAGSLTASSGTMNIAGDFSNLGTFNCSTGTVNFNGTAQNIAGTTYNNLTISGGNIKSLQGNTTIGGTLTFTSGKIVLGANNLTLTGTAAIGTPTGANYIVADGSGQLKKLFATGVTATYVLPIGDATNYSPVSLNFTANSTPRTIGVRVTDAKHPSDGTTTDNISRYWSFTDDQLGTYTFSGTFTYVPADLNGTHANLRVNRWDGAYWTQYTTSSASPTITLSGGTETTATLNGNSFTGRVNTAAQTIQSGTGAPGGVGNTDGTNGQPHLVMWLDASNLTLNNDDAIATWTDRSGNGNDALQTTGTFQPLFKTNIVNSKPAIRFDGTDDFLNLNGSSITNSDLTVIMVAGRRSLGNKYVLAGIDGVTNTNLHMPWLNATQGICNHYGNDITGVALLAGNNVANVFSIFTDRLASAESAPQRRFLQDGTELGNIANATKLISYNGAAIARNSFNGGTSYTYHDVDVPELIFYAQALNTAQQNIVNNYLNAKYGMTIAAGTDKYTSAAGYNFDVAGIGKEADGSQVSSPSAGFYVTEDNTSMLTGEYVLYGHDNRPTVASTNDVPAAPIAVASRWNRIWNIQKTNIDGIDVKISFDFSEGLGGSAYPITVSNYVLLYRAATSGDFSVITTTATLENSDRVTFNLLDGSFSDGYYTLGTLDQTTSPVEGGSGVTWYTLLNNGDWDDSNTWTLDPSGREMVNPGAKTPTTSATFNADKVVILTGKTVTIQPGNNNKLNSMLTVQGRLDITTTTGHSFTTILGSGRVFLAGDNFPTGDASNFISPNLGAGTVIYTGNSRTLSTTRTFCNVEIDMTDNTQVLTLTRNYTINGYLYIKTGKIQINDDASTSIININVAGDVTVDNTGGISTGLGNTIGTYAIPGSMPAGGQYHSIYHQFNMGGNFTNNGVVRFTNLTNPVYNAFAVDGGVTVRFTALSNNMISLNNTTDFYNLIVDKGSDQTYILEINSSNTTNFALYGPNNVGRNGNAPFSAENPEVCKALWIKNGTLKLTGSLTIPSLSEGSVIGGNGDYAIGANAQLWIASSGVRVICTADLTDHNIIGAVGINNGGSNQALSVYGTYRITNGYFNSGYSAGFIFWNSTTSSAEILVDGGTTNVSVFRSSSNTGGKTSFIQTGGTLIVRGDEGERGEVDGTYPLFGLIESQSTLRISGGDIIINDRSTGGVNAFNNGFYINSAPENTSVTGGKITISTNTVRSPLVEIFSNADLWNLDIARLSGVGTISVKLGSPFVIKNDLNINANSSLNANNYDLTLSGNMSITGDYTPGMNTTTFDGTASKTFTNNGTITPLLSNLTINKPTKSLTLAGSGIFTCNGSLTLNAGTLNDGGKSIMVNKDIINSGIHTGSGSILMKNAGIVSTVTITNPGSYTSPPTVTFAAPGGIGTTATGTPILNGVVTGVAVTTGGAGYTGTPTITFAAPSAGGVTATGTVNLLGGAISSITINNGGSGYQSAPGFTIANTGGGAGATLSPTAMSYTVTGVAMTNTGNGYTSIPAVTFSAGTTLALGTAVIYTKHELSGNGLGQFGNLELDESNAAITTILKAKQQINGTLTLTNGILDLDIYNLNLTGSISPILLTDYSTTKMIRTAGTNSDGGLTRYINANGTYIYPLGTNANTNNRYTPASVTISSYSDDGTLTLRPVDKILTTTLSTGGNILSYYWRSNYANFSTKPKVTFTYTYAESDLDGAIDEASFVPGKVLEVSPYTRSSEAPANLNPITNTITFNGGGTPFNLEEASYTAGLSARFTGTPTIYYLIANGNWNTNNSWSYTRLGGAVPVGNYPKAGDIAVIRRLNSGYSGLVTVNAAESAARVVFDDENGFSSGCPRVIFSNNASYNSSFDVVEVASTHQGGVLNGSTHGAVIQYYIDGTYAGQFPTGDFNLFNRYINALVIYSNTAGAGVIVPLSAQATEYPQIWTDPPSSATSYMRFPATNVTVHGMTIVPYANQFLTSNGAGNITFEKQLYLGWVMGTNNGGKLLFTGNSSANNTVTVLGDIMLSDGPAQLGIYLPVAGGRTHTLIAKGNIILNNNNNVFNLGDGNTANTNVVLELQGTSNNTFTNTNTAPVTLYRVLMNKGADQTNNFAFNTNFALTAASNVVLKPMELQNGQLILDNPNINIIASSGGGNLIIPQTAGLIVKQGKVSVTGASTGINLDGLLRIENTGKVWLDGGAGVDNYIEYAASGNAAIQVAGTGELIVGSQIRRSTIATSGVLKYSQTGGTVTVGKNAAPVNQRGVFEVLNAGSDFTFTGGSLSICRAQTNPTIASLYIEPTTSNIATGTTINIGDANTPAIQNIGIYSTVPLQNLVIGTINAPTTKMWVVPLTLNGDLTIGTGSTFDANGLTLTCNGNFTNNGTFRANSNTTIFSGSALQTITGSTSFYNFTKQTTGNTLQLGATTNITVANDFSLLTGILDDKGNSITVMGDLQNTATHATSSGTNDGITMAGNYLQKLFGNGTFGKLCINNASGVQVPVEYVININNALKLKSGVFDIGTNLLTLGVNCSVIEGNPFSSTNMIQTNVSFTDKGVKKIFPIISSPTNFKMPIGSGGKYTPIIFDITNNANNTGSITFKAVNQRHVSITDDSEAPDISIVDQNNVLQYYWSMKASGISNFSANITMQGLLSDAMVTAPYALSDYITAFLMGDGSGNWFKYLTTDYNEASGLLSFNLVNKSDADITGDYTAGINGTNPNFKGAIPNQVPFYETIGTGDWTNGGIWTPSITGGPRGARVRINSGHIVTTSTNNQVAYTTQINGRLNLNNSYGHSLGIVTGTGTLYTSSGNIPAGFYDDFLLPNTGTFDYGGTGIDYDVLSDYGSVNNLVFSGSGKRRLPNITTITVNGNIDITGANLENEFNQKLDVKGNLTMTSGSFKAGTGANAKVSLSGTLPQSISGNFTAANSSAFYNFETNKASASTTLNSAIEVSKSLLLTTGIINTTSSNILTITNHINSAVTGGSSSSFVNGPIKKQVDVSDGFTFPTGKGTRYGFVSISSADAGLWIAEYFNTGRSGTATPSITAPLTLASAAEYWTISGPGAGKHANVTLRWDNLSDIKPPVSASGLAGMRVAEFNTTTSKWEEKVSTNVGDNTNGTALTNSLLNLDTHDYTLACVGLLNYRARFSSNTPVCKGGAIPVEFVGITGLYPYTLSYSINGLDQPDITGIVSSTTTITAATAGTYVLNNYTYTNPPVTPGAFDLTTITVNDPPVAVSAGLDQTGAAMCGRTSTNLAADLPTTGIGTWSINSGIGGFISNPTSRTSLFSGTAGNTYVLYWTVSNPPCAAATPDDVTITFEQAPVASILTGNSTTCAGTNGDGFSVTPGWNYTWVVQDNVGTITDLGAGAITIDWLPNSGIFVGPLASAVSVVKTVRVTINKTPAVCPTILEWNVTIQRVPETGPQYHVPNNFGF
ncbi:MAG: autotransporter-associated beta strand repeat-containing protein [Tenuifilaceae bacterium]